MLFAFVMLIYGGRTERLTARPFLVMIVGALVYAYGEALLFSRPIDTHVLLYAGIYFSIGLLLFLAGHLAVNRFGRDRDTL